MSLENTLDGPTRGKSDGYCWSGPQQHRLVGILAQTASFILTGHEGILQKCQNLTYNDNDDNNGLTATMPSSELDECYIQFLRQNIIGLTSAMHKSSGPKSRQEGKSVGARFARLFRKFSLTAPAAPRGVNKQEARGVNKQEARGVNKQEALFIPRKKASSLKARVLSESFESLVRRRNKKDVMKNLWIDLSIVEEHNDDFAVDNLSVSSSSKMNCDIVSLPRTPLPLRTFGKIQSNAKASLYTTPSSEATNFDPSSHYIPWEPFLSAANQRSYVTPYAACQINNLGHWELIPNQRSNTKNVSEYASISIEEIWHRQARLLNIPSTTINSSSPTASSYKPVPLENSL